MAAKDIFKRIVSKLPETLQLRLKASWYRRQIRRSDFGAGEPETLILNHFLRPGDWVVDVGANIGQYSWQFSNIVGATGRVLAVEPVPETFALLAAHAQMFPSQNVSLFNVALSDRIDTANMFVPRLETGLRNYYQASLNHHKTEDCSCTVLMLPFDKFEFLHSIALIKIDAEGHDEQVITGMMTTIKRDKPVLIVEDPTESTRSALTALGYSHHRLPGSPNTIFTDPSRHKQDCFS